MIDARAMRHLGAAFFTVCLALPAEAADSSQYVAAFQCQGGPLGLRLPDSVKALQALGPLRQRTAGEGGRLDLQFDGLHLGVIRLEQNPERYILAYAEIQDSRWNALSPFHIGDTDAKAASALKLKDVRSPIGSEAGELTLRFDGQKISNIRYTCYTG